MSVNEIKIRIHELIENTEDSQMLEKLYHQLFENQKHGDWWDELSESQKHRLHESDQQYKSGKVVSNEAALQKIQQWLQK